MNLWFVPKNQTLNLPNLKKPNQTRFDPTLVEIRISLCFTLFLNTIGFTKSEPPKGTEASFTWDLYFKIPSDEFQRFEIHVKKVFVNEDGFKKDSTENHITITNLEPSTDYNIRVRVVSVSFKASEYSDNYMFTTADLSDSDLSAVEQLKILVV